VVRGARLARQLPDRLRHRPARRYGLFAERSADGEWDHVYASGFDDSGLYIGACRDCEATVSHALAEHNPVGYAVTNSGGHLVLEDSLFHNNAVGISLNSSESDLPPPSSAPATRAPERDADDHLDRAQPLHDRPRPPDRRQQQPECPLEHLQRTARLGNRDRPARRLLRPRYEKCPCPKPHCRSSRTRVPLVAPGAAGAGSLPTRRQPHRAERRHRIQNRHRDRGRPLRLQAVDEQLLLKEPLREPRRPPSCGRSAAPTRNRRCRTRARGRRATRSLRADRHVRLSALYRRPSPWRPAEKTNVRTRAPVTALDRVQGAGVVFSRSALNECEPRPSSRSLCPGFGLASRSPPPRAAEQSALRLRLNLFHALARQPEPWSDLDPPNPGRISALSRCQRVG
jgi:hypothetical protein